MAKRRKWKFIERINKMTNAEAEVFEEWLDCQVESVLDSGIIADYDDRETFASAIEKLGWEVNRDYWRN